MNETDLKHAIQDYLKLQGFFSFHLLAGLGSFKGSPDKIFIKNGHVVFCEIKNGLHGTQSEYQKYFQHQIESHGGTYLLARTLDDIINYCEQNNLTEMKRMFT